MLTTISGSRQFAATAIAAAVAAAAAASLFLLTTTNFPSLSSSSEDDATKINHKRKSSAPPRSKMGIIETVKMMAGGQVPFQLMEIANDLGSYVFELSLPIPGSSKTFVVGDPVDARAILTDPLTDKPRALYGRLREMTPSGEPSLFTLQSSGLEGEEWHRRRKGTLPAFSPKHVRRMNDVAYKHASEWCDTALASYVLEDKDFDVVHEMLKVVLRAFCETALEYLISDDEMDMFLQEWDLVAKEYIFKSTTNPFRKYLEVFLPERQRARKSIDMIFVLFHRIIDNFRTLDEPIEGTVINRIMTNPTFQNDQQRAAELFAYIVAGHDTTAVTISWTLLELAKSPSEQTRLRDALKELKRDEWSSSDVLRNVVQEGLRIHPVAASVLARQIGRDFVTSRDAYYLQKGSVVFLPIYLLHRNHHLFDDAARFRPSRWDDPSDAMKDGFMPFAAGRQNCVGQALANAELNCILARIIQDFEFTVHEEGKAESYLVLKPVGLRMKARRIK